MFQNSTPRKISLCNLDYVDADVQQLCLAITNALCADFPLPPDERADLYFTEMYDLTKVRCVIIMISAIAFLLQSCA